MKEIIFILCSFIAVYSFASEEIKDFGENSGNLKMYLHVPQNLHQKKTPIPVVIALHGCSQSANVIEKQSGWSKLADENGFIVIYPQQKYSNNGMNCFRWYSYDKKELKEMESIISMLKYVSQNHKIDSSHVFVYGLSAGAMMTGALMLHYPEVFNSGAILAGGPYKVGDSGMELMKKMKNPDDKTPEEWGSKIPIKDKATNYPKLVVLHGEEDGIVDIQNAFELIDQWSFVYNIDAKADSIVKNFVNNKLVEKQFYFDDKGNALIQFYKIKDTGHTLPVDPGTDKNQGGKTGAFAIDRNFYSTYYIAIDFGLILY